MYYTPASTRCIICQPLLDVLHFYDSKGVAGMYYVIHHWMTFELWGNCFIAECVISVIFFTYRTSPLQFQFSGTLFRFFSFFLRLVRSDILRVSRLHFQAVLDVMAQESAHDTALLSEGTTHEVIKPSIHRLKQHYNT